MIVIAAWRNFVRNLRRYRVLLVALVLIVTVLTAGLGVLLGLQNTIREKASRYFAGDLVVLGFDGPGGSVISNPDAVERALASLELGSPTVDDAAPAPLLLRARSRRSTYYDIDHIELFFAGYYTKQRRLVGVEWALERPVLEQFFFVEGGVPEDGDEEAILISTAAARDLGVALGEPLLVSIRSDRGRTSTEEYIVHGVYSESSFFGYTGYVHRRALNHLREADAETVNEIGLYLLPGAVREEREIATALTVRLEDEGLAVFDPLFDREAYLTAARQAREELQYGVVTVGAQLSEITDLLEAITIIAAMIMALFLGIVVVGVSNTWTMVVWERTREIGTLRALGMQRTRTAVLFLLEAVFLGLAGVILGCTLGAALLAGVSRWAQFEPNAFTTLFFTRGRVPWRLPIWRVGSIAMLAVGASVFGALRAAIRAGRVDPVEALRHEK